MIWNMETYLEILNEKQAVTQMNVINSLCFKSLE